MFVVLLSRMQLYVKLQCTRAFRNRARLFGTRPEAVENVWALNEDKNQALSSTSAYGSFFCNCTW